jgi:glycosyltransferase involved in cell wall biosynthesis
LRVAIYAIALNEIAHVPRFLAACADADAIVVADTGSTDGTRDALRDGGAITHAIAIRPWRFDDARNAALALVPVDIDVCIAIDLDEMPGPGWRAALERAWTPETTLGRYRYITAHLPNEAPAVELSGAKIHRRFGYRWRYPCHEYVVPDRLPEHKETWLPGVRIDHWPDSAKSRSGYVALLEAAVAEAPDDPRNVFLLGRDMVFEKRWEDGEAVLKRFLGLPRARSPWHRAAAWRLIARCRAANGDTAEAIGCLRVGLRIAPGLRDLWLDLADMHARLEQWDASYAASRKGLALEIGPAAVANDYAHAGGGPFYRASLTARRLGRIEEARALAVEANAREPGHGLYQKHLRELG